MRSTMPLASSPRCSATSRRTLSRSRSWMCRRTACFAVCAAIRLKSSEGSSATTTVPSGRTTRLRTSSAPVFVSSWTVTSPGALKARVYAAASALSTVCSISSKGMPTSAQSAVSASASVCVDGSDCDREPARDNVIPRYMNDHRRPTAKARRLDCDSRSVDRDQLAFDHGLCFAAVIANVHAIAMKAFVLLMRSQWALRTRRRDLEVVWPVDQPRVIEERTGHPAYPLAILDGDRLRMVDRDTERSTRVTGLAERVELVTHVIQGWLEQLFDRRYGPGWDVRSLPRPYQAGRGCPTALRRPCGRIALLPPGLLATRVDEHVLLRCSAAPSTAATWIAELLVAPSRPPGYLMGCTRRQTTSSGAALKIEL